MKEVSKAERNSYVVIKYQVRNRVMSEREEVLLLPFAFFFSSKHMVRYLHNDDVTIYFTLIFPSWVCGLSLDV